MEEDEALALEDYGVTSIEAAGLGGVLEILIDDSNKDAVDELVTQLIEKIDGEASAKDSQMTKSRQTEWVNIQNNIIDSQHTRGRQIISEIIETTTNFTNSVTNKFQQFRDDDEEENR